jgi:hypothetical protein
MRAHGVTERRHDWNEDLRDRFRQLEERWNRLHPPLAFDDMQDSSAPVGDDELSALAISDENLQVLRTHRPNVLLEGAEWKVTRVADLLTRFARTPIVAYGKGCLRSFDGAIGTLLVSRADRLDDEDQAELFGWLAYGAWRAQVITTATVPLLPLVVRQQFSDALFYRLNQMYLILK